MDKAITTALFIVVSMVLALMLFNIAYPAVIEGGDAINSMAARAEERMKMQISVVHVAAEVDSSGWWQDTNGNGLVDVFAWVKNIGDARVIATEQMDVFWGPEGNFVRVPHESRAGGSFPYWTAEVENATEWIPTATLKITIHYNATLSPGRYFMKVTLPTGVTDEYYMSI